MTEPGKTPLSVDQALEGLRALGMEPDDGTASCPICDGLFALTVRQNGNGAHLACSQGCSAGEISGAIRAGLRQIGLTQAIGPGGPSRWSQARRLEDLRLVLGLPELARVVKHGRLGAAYEFVLDDGRIVALGNAAALQSQAKFRAAYLPQVRRQPFRIKRDDWDHVVETIETAAEERDNVATDAEEARGWIAAYARTCITLDTSDSEALYDHLASGAGPFIDPQGRLYIRLEHLAEQINRLGHGRVTTRELSTRLATPLDFTREQLAARRPAARRGKDTVKARYWASPAGFEVDG